MTLNECVCEREREKDRDLGFSRTQLVKCWGWVPEHKHLKFHKNGDRWWDKFGVSWETMRNRNLPYTVCFYVILSSETELQLASRFPNPHICCVNQNSSRFCCCFCSRKGNETQDVEGRIKIIFVCFWEDNSFDVFIFLILTSHWK